MRNTAWYGKKQVHQSRWKFCINLNMLGILAMWGAKFSVIVSKDPKWQGRKLSGKTWKIMQYSSLSSSYEQTSINFPEPVIVTVLNDNLDCKGTKSRVKVSFCWFQTINFAHREADRVYLWLGFQYWSVVKVWLSVIVSCLQLLYKVQQSASSNSL